MQYWGMTLNTIVLFPKIVACEKISDSLVSIHLSDNFVLHQRCLLTRELTVYALLSIYKLASVFHASVMLLMINFVITLSKKLQIHEVITEWICRLL